MDHLRPGFYVAGRKLTMNKTAADKPQATVAMIYAMLLRIGSPGRSIGSTSRRAVRKSNARDNPLYNPLRRGANANATNKIARRAWVVESTAECIAPSFRTGVAKMGTSTDERGNGYGHTNLTHNRDFDGRGS